MTSDFECLIGDHHSAATAVKSKNVRSATTCKSQLGGVQRTNLVKHVSQVVLGVNPRRHSVTKKNEVLERETDGTLNLEISESFSLTPQRFASPAPLLQG